jgi:lipoprotein-anchoring transpeptidase ErfK/SrfK
MSARGDDDMRQTRTRWTVTGLAVVVGLLGAGRLAAAESIRSTVASPAAPVTRRAVVSLADRKLAVLVNGAVVRVFTVAIGAPISPSPVGRFTIVNRLSEPTYYRPGKVIGPGPSNPLGPRWLGLDRKGYGIHGTDEPQSIGYARSHGCIRLRNEDIQDLFSLLRVGDVVELLDERTPEIARIFGETAPADPVLTNVSVPSTIATDSRSSKE